MGLAENTRTDIGNHVTVNVVNGKTYHAYPVYRHDKQHGESHSTHEYNLTYCVEDSTWFGDCVDASGWYDIPEDEAWKIARVAGYDEMEERPGASHRTERCTV